MRNALALVMGALVAAGSLVGCGGGAKDTVAVAHGPNDVTDAQIDADPIALLPSAAIAVVHADARAFFTSGNLGAQVASTTEKVMPIGDEAGFSASRDVDQVLLGTYSMQGADVVAVLQGRFDAQKIQNAAENHTPTKGGGYVVASEYAGRKLYTVNNVGFTILTPRTAVAGTETGIRRALDRIRDGRVKRDLTPWMMTTIETPNAALALAADFATQPITSAAVGAFPMPWVNGMKAARILGDFKDPGMHIAGTLTYEAEAQAASAADGLRQASTLANLVAMTGLAPQIKDLDIKVAATDVQYTFSVDERSLRGFFAALPSWVH